MAKLGNVMRVYLKPSGGTYTWLKGEQTNSVNFAADAIEVSDKSTDWKQYIAGAKSGTIDVTIFADNSDESQQEARDAFNIGGEVDFFVGTLGTGATADQPTSGDAGKAIVTAISDTNDYGAVSTRNLSLQITGQPTHYDNGE